MPALQPSSLVPNQSGPADPACAVFEARIHAVGPAFSAPASVPLLQAAERAGLALPSSCRNGTCRTCICQLISGQVLYRIEWPGLSAQEKQEGYILPCVAYPASDVVIELPF
ncbi:MAG: 2Fe-2S iron-sulfur cluster binding domain-containing protein [Polaromonas sp.]|uniref:2Fe-2S iron-sulfur cluster-binding protein n=1 Tax=Polaromonas sp. TaxID=1869339 RepID=UPI0027318EA9|nr:2Fe-2S iron-sulfur cluster binding domain-containing protein [Polaromonas sp.]MDP2258017.1 2Fe-2S iron-sulfur cluster binding domain-containing protein [Polaromonas sp.]